MLGLGSRPDLHYRIRKPNKTMKHKTYNRLFALLLATALTASAQPASVTQNTDVIQLDTYQVTGKLEKFSDVANTRKTPVAVTEVDKNFIGDTLSSRDVPFALEMTPSFYVTNSGGGAGDSRISVRGFDQRNISILINGVPTNDNENGWLYWSNWDGLGEATSKIQLQRGLSYSTLPTPSVGGTLNVVTDPAGAVRGGLVKFEIGDDNFMKETLTLNTGLLKDCLALTVSLTNKSGDGYNHGNYTKGQGYYLGASYRINDKNRLEFYAIAAPQIHGQNSYQQSVATYDQAFARKLGFTDAQLALFPQQGPRYNQRYLDITATGYNGPQYYWGGTHSRYDATSMNEAENYYNKPQMNLNWFLDITPDLSLGTVGYWSGGQGGGSSSYNNYASSSSIPKIALGLSSDDQYNYNAIIPANQASAIGSRVVLRNAINDQSTWGLVTKLSYKVSPNLQFSAGLDGRMASIDHWYEIRDLLGGAYFIPTTAQYIHRMSDVVSYSTLTPVHLGLGDKTDYNYTNDIKWLGSFVQGLYETKKITAFGVVGYTLADYKYTNHWVLNDDGTERHLSTPQFRGYQVKGGIQYAFTKNLAAYVNAGVVSKAPVDSVAIYYTGPGRVLTGIKNETFNSFEGGLRFASDDNTLVGSAGVYTTQWNNRSATSSTDNYLFTDGTRGTNLVFQTGINSRYSGVEVEATYAPALWRWVRLSGSASAGNWAYTDDGHKDTYHQTGGLLDTSTPISLKGVKVGNTPQSQVALGVTLLPVKGLALTINERWNGRYWASYTPETRTNDWGQSWRLPDYAVTDLHVNYSVPVHPWKTDVKLFLHALNVFNKTYIQDGTDNYFTVAGAASHTAQRGEVWLGTPLTVNGGVKVSF